MSLSSLRKLLAHRDPSQAVFPTSCALAAAVALFLPAAANAATCPNEQFRTGRSASLPDCRAFELVTPEHVDVAGGNLEFRGGQSTAVASSDGEHLALTGFGVFFEPGSTHLGTRAVFSRSTAGWAMRSLATPGMVAETFDPEVLSPDFSQAGFLAHAGLVGDLGALSGALLVGPVGGPYLTLGSTRAVGGTRFAGANAGVPGGVAAFSDVVVESNDHALLPAGPEREAAEQTGEGLSDLYEWSGGRPHLVNVDSEGKLLNPCGAMLGASLAPGSAVNAVSADGSRVFFTSPQGRGLPGCGEPQLYMRVGGSETVDVSEPEGVSVAPSERGRVAYDGASADGSRVFFTTGTALTPGAGAGFHLYEYDTRAPVEHRLKLIANEVKGVARQLINPGVVVSEDGSVVYYDGTGMVEDQGHPVSVSGIWRYDAAAGSNSFVATPSEASGPLEPWYATPDGRFFMFPAGVLGVNVAGPHGEIVTEPRGVEHFEIYRYSAADGSVMCVSCGERVTPKGKAFEQEEFRGLLSAQDRARTPISISDDGRRVFFQTSAQLVPQDSNENTAAEEGDAVNLGRAADVYEWVQVGSEEAPGVFCGVAVGCTHLISAGEAVGPEDFLGASGTGRDVFFSSAALLVPQAPPGFISIYDARMGGGFPGPPPSAECTSCQGVGSVPPQFGAPASGTFAGAGNQPSDSSTSPAKSKPKPKPKRCKRGYKHNKHGRCVRATSRKTGRR